MNNFLPKWTKKIKIDGGGRDPLGLSKLSGRLVDYLLSGITSNSTRARYYSFYTWSLLNIYDQIPEDGEIGYDVFLSEFRKREAFMALCSFYLQKESGNKSTIVGIEQVKDSYSSGESSGFFNCNFKVLPANELGGYGQYYKGSLENMGFIDKNDYHLKKGTKIAESFQKSIENTIYLTEELYKNNEIEISTLENDKKAFSLDSLLENFAQEELNLLKSSFFEDNKSNENDYRRQSLILILYAISEYEKNNIKITTRQIDYYLVYPVYYYKSLFLSGDFIEYTLPKGNKIKKCFDLWHDFCLHQILIHSMEYLFCSVLETMSFKENNLTLDEVCRYLIENEFIENLENMSKPSDFLKFFGFDKQPTTEECLEMQKKYSPINSDLESEIEIIYKEISKNTKPAIYAARSIYILVILYLKWRSINNLPYTKVIEAGNNICTHNVLPFLDDLIFNSETTWYDLLKKLIQRFVLAQHRVVSFEKKRLDSVWLKTNGNIITKEKEYDPVFRNTRHYSSISILRDLGLLDITNEEISLSNEGKRILETLLNEESSN